MSEQFKDALDGLATGPGASDAEASSPRGPEADARGHASVGALRARFGEAIVHHEVQGGDEHVVFVLPERIVEILRWLKEMPGERYDLLQDLTAVDYGGGRPLQVVYQIWSIPKKRALRLKAELPLADLVIDSATALYATADWLEREVWDLFGIRFRGHPDMRRILMPENYAEGHPLRKDFPLRGRFSRLEQTRRALAEDLQSDYTAEELGIGGRPATGTARGGTTDEATRP